nr:alpha/beta hydrolase [Rhizobium sp. P28RR-XV]
MLSPIGVAMSQTLNAPNGAKPLTVSFSSGDGYVVGQLYLPEGYDYTKRYPAVAIGGSFNSVKEQMGGIYGAEMARRGIMALAIDYRNYGQSSGIMRQYEDADSKADDLLAALAYLKKRTDVSGTGLLGICSSAGSVLYAASKDPSVGAVATVAGSFFEPSITSMIYGADDGVAKKKEAGRKARERFEKTGELEFIPAYHYTDQAAANVGPMDYYMDPSRGGVPEWRNAMAVMSWANVLDFNSVEKASSVKSPTLIVHSDGSAFPDQARKVYDQLAGPKDLYWATGNHFDFYDQAPQVTDAADHVAEHFMATLK